MRKMIPNKIQKFYTKVKDGKTFEGRYTTLHVNTSCSEAKWNSKKTWYF